MKTSMYTRSELQRTFRNFRFFVFSLGFPLVLYFLIAGPNRHQEVSGIPLPLYFMTGMMAFGTMIAVVSSGGRIAAERQIGWNRQLRITPLRARAYLSAKVLTGYAMAATSILLISLAGTLIGVRLSVGEWATLVVLVLIGLIPFAAMGIAIGHLVSVDSLGPLMGGLTSILALLGGAWGPIATSGALHTVSEAMPSYWLVEAGKTAVGGDVWPVKGWLVVAAWSVAMAVLASWAYRRDTAKA
ncbi:ABC transporter permease [Aquihabitans sp. McL0605]|uniref:ABC transporter permease n=1 Tax=Aquihabitans sp. McL0605 TaxID=3415671 RepID=UPI003CEEB4F1